MSFHCHQITRGMAGCSKLCTKVYLMFIISLNITKYVENYIGIGWGRMNTQRMIPSMVIDMILQNGIRDVRIYTASKNVLPAFSGTDIGLTVSIPNDDLKNITDVIAAKRWLEDRVAPFLHGGVKIRYITIGSTPFSPTYFNKTYFHAIDVLQHFQTALKEAEFAKRGIKAVMSHFTDVLVEVKKPSEGDFLQEIRDYIIYSCQLLQEDNAPLWLDIFPIYNVKRLFNNDIEFAFFNNNSTSVFMDGDIKYNNVFEVIYDTFIVALRKAGIFNLTIIIGQVGWPTDGIDGANIPNAQRFHKGFLQHIQMGRGTPLHPSPIDAYIHGFTDENKLSTVKGGFMRHWGVYRSDGKPKYSIDLSGKGRNIKPVTGIGITHMPKRWCIFNNKTSDLVKIKRLFDFACNASDCTSMAPGGSCGDLTFSEKISYAFNIYYQAKSQKISDEGCDFEGLGVIIPNDPSTVTCTFPVEILSAETFVGNGTLYSNGICHVMDAPKFVLRLFTFLILILHISELFRL